MSVKTITNIMNLSTTKFTNIIAILIHLLTNTYHTNNFAKNIL